MPPATQFSYYISSSDNPVSEEHPMWNTPLALTRDFNMHAPVAADTLSVTVGDYFLAARLFFETCGIEYIVDGASLRLKKDIKPGDITAIAIFLVKHGEFYHPARIDVCIHEEQIPFVLNVAISAAGKAHIKGEYRYLKRLNQEYPFDDLPQVYGLHEVEIAKTSRVPMFLGEWLPDYHEFHISKDPADGQNKIIVWDTDREHFFLTSSQSLDLYTRAAGIQTGYYNLETFEQIDAWHHAAGDFVVRLENNKLDLKLITVRRYAPALDKSILGEPGNLHASAEYILQAMLVFFLNLALKMRLDRLDGVGEIVWADETAVQGTLVGFLNALASKSDVPALPDTPLRCFFSYLLECTKADVRELSESLLNRFNPGSPEIDAIKQNLDRHIDTLHNCIHEL